MTFGRSFFGCCLAMLLAALSVGCTGGDKTTAGGGGTKAGTKRFVFLINTPDPFWDTCNAGLKQAEKDLKLADAGLSITMEPNDGTVKGQVDKLRQFASQSDIVGVAISALENNNEAIVEEMKKLQDKGVHVITVDGDVDTKLFPDARPYYIGTDNTIAGKQLGTATHEILKAKGLSEGGIVHFVGKVDNDNAKRRMNGFMETVGKEYTEIDRMADDGQIGRAQDNVRNALLNHKDKLNCLVGIWAYNGPAIASTTSDKPKDKLARVTFDAAADSLVALEKGDLDALCVQQPFDFGFQAVRLLKAMHEKDEATIKEMFPNAGQPGGDTYTTGIRIVVPPESPVKADKFDPKLVEFMTLEQMQEWLKKYSLTSS